MFKCNKYFQEIPNAIEFPKLLNPIELFQESNFAPNNSNFRKPLSKTSNSSLVKKLKIKCALVYVKLKLGHRKFKGKISRGIEEFAEAAGREPHTPTRGRS